MRDLVRTRPRPARLSRTFGWQAWTVGVAILAILCLVLARHTAADHDMYHEMALIRESLAAGTLVKVDLWAYTPTIAPVVHHEWGTGAVLYLLTVGAGLGGGGIIALRLALLAGTAAACLWCLRQKRAPLVVVTALAPVPIALLALGSSPVRAHLFTFLFTAVLLAFLELDRRGRRWWVPAWLAIHVVWLNVHGGFVVGAGLFALHVAERLISDWHAGRGLAAALHSSRHLLAVGMAMAVLLLANPYGGQYVPYLWHALLLDRPLIGEWAPIWDSRVQREYTVIYGVSVLVALYAAARANGRVPGLLVVLVTALLAARSQRLLPIHGIVWIAHVPAWLGTTELRVLIERTWSARRTAIAAAAAVIASIATIRAVQMRFWELRLPTTVEPGVLVYPVGAVEYLADQDFAGNLMTPFNAGAYVSWKLHPNVRIGMDSRYEVAFPPGAVEENVALYDGDGDWRALLEGYGTDAVLVPTWSGLYSILEDRPPDVPGWRRVYRDDAYAIYAAPQWTQALRVVDRTGDEIRGSFP